MARLLILAHAPLASALRAVAEHTFPELVDRIEALDVGPQEAPEQVERRARDWLAQPGSDPDALVLTDVFGATPANVAQRLSDGSHVRVIAGVNVPMLWRALNYARLPLDELVSRALIGATQGVLPIASTRPQNQVQSITAHDSIDHHHQQ
ncbi:MAG: PTS sugar transporter subunit IIA [Leptothrix sp. (in: b-proteobacteria)]